MIPVDVNTGPMLKSGLSAYSLHIAVAIHVIAQYCNTSWTVIIQSCGKYIQGTKRKGKEEGKGNIAAFTFESHEDSKRRRGDSTLKKLECGVHGGLPALNP
ncbi:hypothetical protein NC652_026650 [Populus alba x Populus x berolinensis]|nr:hypothetical protein NC652_026650 [Populus alba x Populus x berolinensis]